MKRGANVAAGVVAIKMEYGCIKGLEAVTYLDIVEGENLLELAKAMGRRENMHLIQEIRSHTVLCQCNSDELTEFRNRGFRD